MNNREIKFRAWDGKQMRNDVGILDGEVIEYAERTYDTPNTEIDHWKDWKIMQYTGLKDKNGKEIYEGDIVRVLGDGWLDIVSWNYGCFLINKIGRTSIYYRLNEFKVPEEFEIIGNIYENPELLVN